jgi:cytochrome c oxidase accessory protein FixG
VNRRIVPIRLARSAAGDAPAAAPATVSLYVSEAKIQPRAVHGWFAAWRWGIVWATQLVFYGLPWLLWNGRPALLFDLAARRFYIFGLVLYPQDFIYLAGLLILSAYGLFLFTAVAGRLWCGYACPQTVYTEIFMWIEHRLEGDRNARLKLDRSPWTPEKVWRRGAKHVVWLALSLWTGFTFVAYFTPARELLHEAVALGLGPWETFWIGFYGLATYGNAGWMREQVCKYMCPYARFQSAMFDKDTLIISYDPVRGEPRGSRPRGTDPRALGKGDCVDCTLCVQVCPTGIDIRKGLQYECIGCAACIDACDQVMDKMRSPRGLIRYATHNGLAHGWSRAQLWKRVLRPRVLVYSAVMLVITSAFGAALVLRAPFRADVVRDRGALARIVQNGHIENVYRLQLMNATEAAQRYRIEVEGLAGAAVEGGRVDATVAPTESRWVPVSVLVPPDAARAIGPGPHPLRFRIALLAEDGATPRAEIREKSTFIVPR